jgi:short-subunit dehydrogenase
MSAKNQARAQPEHVLITGASSGLGAALATAYAAPGVRLALFGRDEARLRQVAQRCQALGARVAVILADVTDSEVMASATTLVDDAYPIDLVIANAGISGAIKGDRQAIERLFAVNVMGVVHTVEPLLPRLLARGRGQIALLSSLASFVSRPGAEAYCASKAAVRIWGEGLGERLRPKGLGVSVVCPGFVDTPLTRRNPFPMPMLMTAEAAATLIRDRLARGETRIAFPRPMYWGARLAALVPDRWQRAATRRWPGKE